VAYNYLVPRVSPLLADYNCTGSINVAELIKRLRDARATLRHTVRIYHEGAIVDERVQILDIRDGALANSVVERYSWTAVGAMWGDIPGFLEEDVRVVDGAQLFASKHNRPTYVAHWSPCRKGYLINLSPKFADPRAIDQIAEFNRFVDTCSTVWVDQERDYGESFIFVNPFTQPIVVKIQAEDGRTIRGTKIPPLSGRRVGLDRLLRGNERSWQGQVQITASNRLLISNCKHSFSDPSDVTDLEHLDPYRTDPTHLPAFKWLRIRFGHLRSALGADMRRLKT